MLGFLRRRPVSGRPMLTRPLQVERLDERLVPAAATISGLGGRIIGSNMIVYGTVQDDSAGADAVTASGGLSGTKSTVGDFEFIGAYSGNGTVNLVVRDDEGLDSQTYSISLSPSATNQAPYVTFTVAYGQQRGITLSGTVYDENPAGTTVTVSGVASASSIQPNMMGGFSVSLSASGLGVVNVRATDTLGLQSNLAGQTLTTNKPVIEQFTCTTISPNTHKFRGKVIDESAQGLVMHFSGITGLNNVTATVGSDGWFEVTVILADNQYGWVTADVSDWWGVAADSVSDYLAP